VLLVFAIVGGIALSPLLWILVVAAVVVGAIALLSHRPFVRGPAPDRRPLPHREPTAYRDEWLPER
jgi:hypothetical protein